MRTGDSAIQPRTEAPPDRRSGPAWGFLGVLAFSFTVPFTRVAVGGLSPLFIGSGRAVVAAALAGTALLLTRQPLPRGRQWPRLAVVAGGIVLGFPLLTSYALTRTSAGHGAMVIAVLPAVTAAVAAVRGHERLPRRFWLLSLLGAAAAVLLAVLQSGIGSLHVADLLLFAAVLAAAVGYAEGGLLARELGPWQTVCWALVLAAPVMLGLAVLAVLRQAPVATPAQWAAFGYLAVVSMFLGFFAWYRGLEIGPMATVSQVQLVQPVFSIAWAALLLGEEVTWSTVLGAVAVIACATATVRVRLRPRPAAPHG